MLVKLSIKVFKIKYHDYPTLSRQHKDMIENKKTRKKVNEYNELLTIGNMWK